MNNKIKPGEIYISDEPELIGSFPVRTDIEVLPADDASKSSIRWSVRTYDGGEVYKDIDAQENLKKFSDIKKDDTVIVPTLFGYVEMKIIKKSRLRRTAVAETANTLAWLDFSKDDRKCWTSSGSMNKKVKKLSITK